MSFEIAVTVLFGVSGLLEFGIYIRLAERGRSAFFLSSVVVCYLFHCITLSHGQPLFQTRAAHIIIVIVIQNKVLISLPLLLTATSLQTGHRCAHTDELASNLIVAVSDQHSSPTADGAPTRQRLDCKRPGEALEDCEKEDRDFASRVPQD